MNSLPISEQTPSIPFKCVIETKRFSRFGYDFELKVKTETRQEWKRNVYIDGVLMETPEQAAGKKPTFQWDALPTTVDFSYVVDVDFKDAETCTTARPVEIFTTPDGPILGIVMTPTENGYNLLDPCVLQYDSNKGTVKYSPIFGVARNLFIERTAVRARFAPTELILAGYPGFLLENRMGRYCMRIAQGPEFKTEI